MRHEDLLTVDYLTAGEISTGAAAGAGELLGVAAFGTASVDAGGAPLAQVQMNPLGTSPTVLEVWRAPGPVRDGHCGIVRYRATPRLLFGTLALAESGVDPNATGTPLERVTALAYSELFDCLAATDYPHLLRVWNYLPQINADSDGVERYRRFNQARQRAFQVARRAVAGDVPAACALGSAPGSPLLIYFLAGVAPGTAIENPRQVAAYRYPPEYGEYTPTFARAMLAHEQAGGALLISGTASIVGHRTVHENDVRAQTRETVANIRALLGEANRVAGGPEFAAASFRYKVYIRNPADVAAVSDELCTALGRDVRAVWLHADVCRADLLVEIEAAGNPGPARSP